MTIFPAGEGQAPPAPPYTDWLRHRLTISGPAEAMARFRAAAAGSGLIPWVLDLGRMEEDWRLQLLAPREGEPAISPSGARILSRRLRDAAAANHQAALARAATDRSCPFDLHRLVPLPPAILALGPDDAEARRWLWAHWGTTRALRHVRALPGMEDARSTRTDRMAVEFWSADWSPWRALLRLRRDWPPLVWDLRPDYQRGGEDAAPAGRGRRRR
ncbi:hypothetical protein CR162_09525 [Pseudoroseomonas rhizosphaerae]|uniref:Uncharacterized protein n=1 Tax=Teichococcus rhizosphaerae TaxID=1335062 RepID=A0A2C6Y315_9PROT|nr:hypothetical protein [Pseudoroseomonas rhizosphaerae]PHK95192.1 hypothetical protein CR162_09525 [Pseudoroseomonas rhizosphaerae]